MSIPERASMAPKRDDLRDVRLERAVIALENLNKTLNYINTNIFELVKGISVIERAIDANTSAVGGP